jgi:hypothetical protein
MMDTAEATQGEKSMPRRINESKVGRGRRTRHPAAASALAAAQPVRGGSGGPALPGNATRLGLLAALAILIATALPAQAQDAPTNLTTWADLDEAVANAYAGLTHEFMLYPPGRFQFGFGQGYVTFSPDGELAAITNRCACNTQYGVPTWQMSVIETQTTPRAWLYIGSGDAAFRTNECPASYDPIQWVITAYGHAVPRWVTGTNVDQWYADRERSRFVLHSTFVNANDWPTLQAAQQAAATNNPPPGTWSPSLPADTNNIQFLNILPSSGAMDLWIYAPAARPMAVLMSTNLVNKKWTLLGCFGAVPAFNLWRASGSAPIGMYRTDFVDVDTDDDGLPNFIETYVLGTDPNYFDTVGSALGDYYRVMIYGLDPLSANTVGDGIPDAWKIANGINPLDPAVSNEDPDGDGLNNQVEYLRGTSPNIPSTLDAANTATLRTATPLSR